MGEKEFSKFCKEQIQKYYKEHRNEDMPVEDIFVVWFSKTLQNTKGLFSTTHSGDHTYVEMTYNGDKQELYMDVYDKLLNQAIPCHLVAKA